VLRRVLTLAVVVALALVLALGCDDSAAACEVDVDCGAGLVCLDRRCVAVRADAAAPAEASAPPPACVVDGEPCFVLDDCCSRSCNAGRCGVVAPPRPTCRGVSELCQNDCCAGLTCINGACR